MIFPLCRQYTETILNPEGLFRTLNRVSAVDDQYCSGNFGIIFKIHTDNGTKALKCFTRAQRGRLAAYQKIAEQIKPSQYIVQYEYLPEEIFVYDDNGEGQYYPVVTMEWVSGQTLSHYIAHAVGQCDIELLKDIATKFEAMSTWLLAQPFAHNDIKPDNIMVRSTDATLVLIDYDGMFVESMEGETARELGTEPFQSPNRVASTFNRHIDDYSLAYIRKALRVLISDLSRYCPLTLVNFTRAELSTIEDRNELFGSDFQYLGSSIHGTMIYRKNGLYGFVQTTGQRITDAIFDAVENFSAEGLAGVSIGGKWGYVDRNGRIVINLIYDSCTKFSNHRAAVSLCGKWGYIDPQGAIVAKIMYDNAWSYRGSLALVCRNGKYGYLGNDGRVAIPLRYDFANSFTDEGVACVMVGGKYGYIDTRARWYEPPIYDYATSFRDGKAAVEHCGREFFISAESRR